LTRGFLNRAPLARDPVFKTDQSQLQPIHQTFRKMGKVQTEAGAMSPEKFASSCME
jgi:hypothetical protein